MTRHIARAAIAATVLLLAAACAAPRPPALPASAEWSEGQRSVVQGPLHVGTLGPHLPGIPESLNAALADDLRNAGLRVVTAGQAKGDLLLRIDTLERGGARAVVLRDDATLDELEAVADRLVCYSSAWGLVPGTRYKLSLRLHDTQAGRLLASSIGSGRTVDELDDSSTRAADELFSQR